MHDFFMRSVRVIITLWFAAGVILSAQETKPSPPPIERSLESLNTIVDPLSNSLAEIKRLRKQLKEAHADAKPEIQALIDSEKERVSQFRENIRDVIGGAEAAGYEAAPPADTTLQDQISDLIQPLLSEIREATSLPREMDDLRKELKKWTERQQRADAVVDRIDLLSAKNDNPTLKAELDTARRQWSGRLAEASGQISVIQLRIDRLESLKKPVWETLSDLVGRFFRTRGLNLILALGAGILGFAITRRVYAGIRRVSPAHRGKNNLTSRAADILAMVVAVLVAIISVLLVLYSRGDWLLLTLAAFMILGAAWAAKNAVPPYIEQIRLLLNLGPVREDERILFNDLPWKVSSLGFLTTLKNPLLEGELRIPIRRLMGMMSRDPDPDEPWFPSRIDDWVMLADGTFGKIIHQTPEQVIILRLGGSLKTFPTTKYLEQTPENLSRGFRISTTFGIDYQHIDEATTTVLEVLTEAITKDLVRDFGSDSVRSIKVEFAAAGPSSLDIDILADFDGSLASRFNLLRRRIQRICVDTCQAHGWSIPFPQLTVHQAPPLESAV